MLRPAALACVTCTFPWPPASRPFGRRDFDLDGMAAGLHGGDRNLVRFAGSRPEPADIRFNFLACRMGEAGGQAAVQNEPRQSLLAVIGSRDFENYRESSGHRPPWPSRRASGTLARCGSLRHGFGCRQSQTPSRSVVPTRSPPPWASSSILRRFWRRAAVPESPIRYDRFAQRAGDRRKQRACQSESHPRHVPDWLE